MHIYPLGQKNKIPLKYVAGVCVPRPVPDLFKALKYDVIYKIWLSVTKYLFLHYQMVASLVQCIFSNSLQTLIQFVRKKIISYF